MNACRVEILNKNIIRMNIHTISANKYKNNNFNKNSKEIAIIAANK